MSLQVDGGAALDEQERQLQFIEAFFVEVVDYSANSGGNNDVSTKPISGPPDFSIRLVPISAAGDLASAVSGAQSIVFDRNVLVQGASKRVLGIRK